MADQQQLDLLRQGVKAWNAWRERHPHIHPNLSKTDLSGVDLSRANLSGANLSEADLREADLSETDLREADLREADLGKANLSGANLSEANLRGADLSGADLSEADLSRVDLSRANLSKANLSYAAVGLTIFGDIDLRKVEGLETVHHYDPSTIGADTLLRSGGKIPETFLRKAGLTDAFITSLRSLTPTKYYTCFISHSSKDKEFVESLYADLQSKGVRCWLAQENMKTGDKIRPRIDESIHRYDKLLLVLSQHSIASTWVELEVEMALAKEQEVNRTVLFPIRLDRAIIDMEQDGWPAEVRRTRHITDFEHWKEHDAYQKSLKRLLRDLEPDHPPTSKP